MIFNKIKTAIALSALLTVSSFSMETIPLEKNTLIQDNSKIFLNSDYCLNKSIIPIIEIRPEIESKEISISFPNPVPNCIGQSLTTSREILGKSLAYGMIEGAVAKSTFMLENVLYNAVIQKGPDAAAFLSEELGKIVGYEGGKIGVKLAVTVLVNAMTAPVSGPCAALAIVNAFAMLDGIIKDSVLKRIDEGIKNAKEKIAHKAGEKAGKFVNDQYLKNNETKDEEKLRILFSKLAKRTAKLATSYGLDSAEDLFKEKGQEYIHEFIKKAGYAEEHALVFEKVMTTWAHSEVSDIAKLNLWFNYPLHEIKKRVITTVSDDLLKNELSFIPITTSYCSGFTGWFVGKIAGNYIFQEAADKYLNGISQKCVGSLKENEFMIYLEQYKNVSRENYLMLLEWEIAQEEKRKESQKRHEVLDQLWAEAQAEERAQLIEQERKYELMYANHYGYNTSIVAENNTPKISFIWRVGGSLYNFGSYVVNGVYSCVNYASSCWQNFMTSGGNAVYRRLSPKRVYTIGHELSENIVENLFLKIIEKGNLYPGKTEDQIIELLNTKQSNKDTYSYKICDGIVQGSKTVGSWFQNAKNGNGITIDMDQVLDELEDEVDRPHYYLEYNK